MLYRELSASVPKAGRFLHSGERQSESASVTPHCSYSKNPFPAWLFMMLLDNLALDQLHRATYGLHITVMVNKSVAGRLRMKL